MKNFKNFITEAKKSVPPILITAMAVHGSHAKKQSVEPTIISATPVHGSHAKKQIKESWFGEKPLDHREWIEDHENNHIGESPNEVHSKLNKPAEEHNSIPGAEHVHEYTHFSQPINHELISRATGTPTSMSHKDDDDAYQTKYRDERREKHNTIVHGIDSAIKHSKLPHDIHVYHGTDQFNPGAEAAKHPEGHIKLPPYISTSISKNTAIKFANADHPNKPDVGSHVIHIHMKKSQHGLYTGDNSKFPKEREMILPRNQTLKIHPKPTKLNNGTHVWHATVHDQPV